jgi:hypothetical protein
MSEQGIDLARSAWENPEGFKPRERDHGAVKVVKVCEAPGPDGWVCDLSPGHGPDHKADDGGQGVRWSGPMADVSQIQDPEPVLIPAYDPARLPSLTEAVSAPLVEIHALAEAAMSNPSPAAWAVALDKILELTK